MKSKAITQIETMQYLVPAGFLLMVFVLMVWH
jgi:hypothetical protein